MRKNRSFKDNSFGHGRGSRGKEVGTSRGEETRRASERLNCSSWQQNPHISQNILKELMGYSNLSANKSSTVAVYEKENQGISGKDRKASKKAPTACEPKFKSKKLVLGQRQNGQDIRKSALLPGCDIVPQTQDLRHSMEVGSLKHSIDVSAQSRLKQSYSEPVMSEETLTKIKEKTARLEQISVIEETIKREYAEVIPVWEKLINSEGQSDALKLRQTGLTRQTASNREQLEQLNGDLLEVSREMVASRRAWQEQGTGGRSKVLQEAQQAHQQLVRKIATVRDFEQTVMFDMKVAIPEQPCSSQGVQGVYEELFRSRNTRKFTMILKKHASHMDLYEGKVLNEYAKRVNQLQGLYARADQQQSQHSDEGFLSGIETTVVSIDRVKATLEVMQKQASSVQTELSIRKEEEQQLRDQVQQVMKSINSQMRGEYSRETEQQADFLELLRVKYREKYSEFRGIQQQKEELADEINELRL